MGCKSPTISTSVSQGSATATPNVPGGVSPSIGALGAVGATVVVAGAVADANSPAGVGNAPDCPPTWIITTVLETIVFTDGSEWIEA